MAVEPEITTLISAYREFPHSIISRNESNDACIVCRETKQYRKLTMSHILSGDRVFELGCSFGKCTEMILRQPNVTVIAVDNSEECTQSTAELCKNAIKSNRLHVERSDIMANPAQCVKIGKQLGEQSVVFVDIGGNRDCATVLSVVVLLLQELKPVLIVVKCRELHKAVLEYEANNDKQGCSSSFWKSALTDAKLQFRRLSSNSQGCEDMNPYSNSDKICWGFLNHGRCKHKRCVYRHLGPLHPDAIADKKKRAQIGWKPQKTRPKRKRKAVESRKWWLSWNDNSVWVMVILALVAIFASWCSL